MAYENAKETCQGDEISMSSVTTLFKTLFLFYFILLHFSSGDKNGCKFCYNFVYVGTLRNKLQPLYNGHERQGRSVGASCVGQTRSSRGHLCVLAAFHVGPCDCWVTVKDFAVVSLVSCNLGLKKKDEVREANSTLSMLILMISINGRSGAKELNGRLTMQSYFMLH